MHKRFSSACAAVGMACVVAVGQMAVAAAADRAWEVVGEFVSLKEGDSSIVVLRVKDGRLLEVPIDALSETSREAIDFPNDVDGSPQPADVDSTPQSAVDAIAHCRTAGEVADTCRLVLAAEDIPAAERKALEAVRDEWDAKAMEGLVRHDKEWVSAEVAADAARAADELIRQGAEMARLGNLRLAEEKLREASTADPASGRADFLIGLAYLGGPRPDFEKAQGAFTKVVRREPAHAAALNNLAVCELQRRRYPAAVEAFREAAQQSAEAQGLATNLAYVIRLAGDRRSRVPARVVEEVNEIYQQLLRANDLPPPENAMAPVVFRSDGKPVSGNWLDELVELATGGSGFGDSQGSPGIVVAPGIVAVRSDVIRWRGSSGLEVRGGDAVRVPARPLATIADGGLTLLACDGLALEPIAWAQESPANQTELLVLECGSLGEPTGRPSSATKARAVSGPTGRERRRIVLEAAAAHALGAAILDQAGRLVGFVGVQPMAVHDSEGGATGRCIGVPLEELRATLEAKKREPPSATADAEPVSAEEAAGRVMPAVVTVAPALPGP
jgi:Flp pilus assembly protein TadD